MQKCRVFFTFFTATFILAAFSGIVCSVPVKSDPPSAFLPGQSVSSGNPCAVSEPVKPLASTEGCTLAIVRDTSDGSIVMMKHRDVFGGSSGKNIVEYVPASAGNYAITGVFEGAVGSTTWMGANTEGMCLVQSYACNLDPGGGGGPSNGEINYILLRKCKSVDEVDAMLSNPSSSVGPGKRSACANIGIIDRFGGAAFFEVDCTDHVRCDVTGTFTVRTNWAIYHPNRTSSTLGVERYYRAKGLIENATSIDYKWMCHVLSKDLGPKPYPTTLTTQETLSQYCTVSSAVFNGGRANYSGKSTCMWTSLGEPSLGLYTPVFPYAGATPASLDDFNDEIHKKKMYCYSSYTDTTMQTAPLLQIQNYSLQIEDTEFSHYDLLMRDVLKNPPMTEPNLLSALQAYELSDTDNATYYYINEIKWLPPIPELFSSVAILHAALTLVALLSVAVYKPFSKSVFHRKCG